MQRVLLKIIIFFVSVFLSVISAFLFFLLNLASIVLLLFMIICVIVSVTAFFQNHITVAIQAIVLAFLCSPYGLPLFGEYLIGLIQRANNYIKSLM